MKEPETIFCLRCGNMMIQIVHGINGDSKRRCLGCGFEWFYSVQSGLWYGAWTKTPDGALLVVSDEKA